MRDLLKTGSLLFLVLCAVLRATPATTADSVAAGQGDTREPRVVRIGFRTDAPPFSYRIQTDQGPRYVGYLADLCYRIFQGTEWFVEAVPVTTEDRFSKLRTKEQGGTETGLVDMLCDPTTIRVGREASSFRRGHENDLKAALYSPIVFVSGISYLRHQWRDIGDVQLGYVTDTTSTSIAIEACQRNTFNLRREPGRKLPAPSCLDKSSADHVAFGSCAMPPREGKAQVPGQPPLAGEQADADAVSRGLTAYGFCRFRNHEEAMDWFCDHEKYPHEKVYFGDRDIILAKLGARKANGRGCPNVDENVERQHPSITYEPYALVVSKTNPDLFQLVQSRVYQLFSHHAEALGLFETYFPGQTMTDPLAHLFLLNAVSRQFGEPVTADESRETGEGG